LIWSADLIVEVMLLAAGAFLWKMKRRGLFLLIAVLVTEFIYAASISLALLAPRTGSALAKGFGYLVGMGLSPLSVQIVTAFPLVAGILIFFAYRYLGIPARPIE
jgi:hypothetical protein